MLYHLLYRILTGVIFWPSLLGCLRKRSQICTPGRLSDRRHRHLRCVQLLPTVRNAPHECKSARDAQTLVVLPVSVMDLLRSVKTDSDHEFVSLEEPAPFLTTNGAGSSSELVINFSCSRFNPPLVSLLRPSISDDQRNPVSSGPN